ncbi:MAG: anthranilate synthase component I family protein [Leadbetterella sp.]
MEFKIKTKAKTLLADTITPVGIFLRIREHFPFSALLESADYHAMSNSFSYIVCDPVGYFKIDNDEVTKIFPNGQKEDYPLENRKDAVKTLQEFAASFVADPEFASEPASNGLYGHIAYDSINYFEDIQTQAKTPENAIPQIQYRLYRYVIAINHFKNEMRIYEHDYTGKGPVDGGLDMLEILVQNPKKSTVGFQTQGAETSNFEDDAMRDVIKKCIGHCLRGDVFQIVPSRRFKREFKGDDFQVYRALRSVNPSPYMFYFDEGDYHIFGSSPEKQIFIQGDRAEIHPIAGTFRRTGDDEKDAEIARQLHSDPKESAEHVMLVDLARNDLSRNSSEVKVEIFKEVQYYSHVIHLVSKVSGKIYPGTNPVQLVADTFPAGTLSGSPKHMAMTLIDSMEPTYRGIYGGAIGFMNFNGDFNHCIAIRTFLSKNNALFYQAGMGVVAKSDVETELNEIHLKLGALRKAIEMAENLN